MINDLAELERVRAECKKMVTKRAMMSAGAAVVPVPGTDVVADIGILMKLLPDISRRFGLDEEQVSRLDPHLAQQILVVASSIGNSLIGKAITKQTVIVLLKKVGVRVATKSVTKYIPLIGSAVAASVSFGAMKIVGNSHVDDCYETVKRSLSGATAPVSDVAKVPKRRSPAKARKRTAVQP